MATTTVLAAQLGTILKSQNIMLVLAESCTGGMVSQFITSIPGSSVWFDRAYITYSNQSKIDALNVSSLTLEQFGAVSEQVAVEMALGAFNNNQRIHISDINKQLNLHPDKALNTEIESSFSKLRVNKQNIDAIEINQTKNCNVVAASITGIAGPKVGYKKSNATLRDSLPTNASNNLRGEKPVGLVCFGFVVNNKISAVTQHFKGTRRQIRLQATIYVMTQIIALVNQAN